MKNTVFYIEEWEISLGQGTLREIIKEKLVRTSYLELDYDLGAYAKTVLERYGVENNTIVETFDQVRHAIFETKDRKLIYTHAKFFNLF